MDYLPAPGNLPRQVPHRRAPTPTGAPHRTHHWTTYLRERPKVWGT